jgi:hypothetical protein
VIYRALVFAVPFRSENMSLALENQADSHAGFGFLHHGLNGCGRCPGNFSMRNF